MSFVPPRFFFIPAALYAKPMLKVDMPHQIPVVTPEASLEQYVVWTLGPQEGNANNLVEATFPSSQAYPASFTASGRVPGDPAQTTIAGVVLDNSNVPIPGVTIRAVLTNILNSNVSAIQSVAAVQTDTEGQFALPQAPVGFVKLLVDGSTAQLPLANTPRSNTTW